MLNHHGMHQANTLSPAYNSNLSNLYAHKHTHFTYNHFQDQAMFNVAITIYYV